MPGRAILGPHARFVVTDRLAPSQPPQHFLDDVLVDVKFRDVMADVFVAGVSEHFQFGPIYAQDDSISSSPMKRNGGILEKVRQLMLTTPEFVQLLVRNDFLPSGHLIFFYDRSAGK